MIHEKQVDVLENSSVRVKITVSGESTQNEYDSTVKEYCKTVHLKGFRKGKVPPDVLVRKLGPEIRGDVARKVIEGSVEEAMESIEQKPIGTSVPEITAQDDIEPGKDFSFELQFDTYPKVNLGNHRGIEIEELEVEIKDDDVQREIERLQDQNSFVVEKEDGSVVNGDIVAIDHVELDAEGVEIEKTRRESFVFQVGTKYNVYEIDDEVTGMKSGEEKIITKEFAKYSEKENLAGRVVKLKVKIKSVKEKKLPEIDDELAQDINEKYQTLDDLKQDIHTRLEALALERSREYKIGQIMNKIVEDSDISLPKSLVESQTAQQWKELVDRFNGKEDRLLHVLEEQDRTREQMLESLRARATQSQKMALAVTELIGQEEIEATDEDLQEDIRRQAEAANREVSEIEKDVKDSKLEEDLKFEIRKRRLFDLLLEHAKIVKTRKIGLQEPIENGDSSVEAPSEQLPEAGE